MAAMADDSSGIPFSQINTRFDMSKRKKAPKNEKQHAPKYGFPPYKRPPYDTATHTMNADQIALMYDLVEIPTTTYQTERMQSFILEYLKNIEGIVTVVHKDGNIYVTKGKSDTYPAVIAHTDTVHPINHNVRAYINGDVMFAIDTAELTRFGTGGDDKVGIFIALECLRYFDAIKVAFFRDEERGCVGSRAADLSFFEDCSFVAQADRRGRYDVTETISGTPMLSQEFIEATKDLLKAYKRVLVSGMMTDVEALVNKGLKICAFNMSCGYYEPHTPREYINLLHVQETLNFTTDLILQVGFVRWPFEHRKPAWSWNKNEESSYSSPSRASYPATTTSEIKRIYATDAKQEIITFKEADNYRGGTVVPPSPADRFKFRASYEDFCPMHGHYLMNGAIKIECPTCISDKAKQDIDENKK